MPKRLSNPYAPGPNFQVSGMTMFNLLGGGGCSIDFFVGSTIGTACEDLCPRESYSRAVPLTPKPELLKNRNPRNSRIDILMPQAPTVATEYKNPLSFKVFSHHQTTQLNLCDDPGIQ